MKQHLRLKTPWHLTSEGEFLEDTLCIVDAAGNELARSRPLVILGKGTPEPPTLVAFRHMVTAPQLLEALEELLRHTVERDLKQGVVLSKRQDKARQNALAVIANCRGE